MGSLLLSVFFLLTFLLGRVRQLGSSRLSRFIPSMVFFRVSLAAALLSNGLQGAGLKGDIVDWIAVVAKTGLYVAFVELALDGGAVVVPLDRILVGVCGYELFGCCG